jgi:hypothetical protein
MSIIRRTEVLAGWRRYTDALCQWFQNGVVDIHGLRIEADENRRIELTKTGGNVTARFARNVKIWSGFLRVTGTEVLITHPEVQRALADKEIKAGILTLHFDGDMVPTIAWNNNEKYVELTWPRSNVKFDVAGVPNIIEPYLRAVRIWPNGTGDLVLSSNKIYSVKLKFE